MRSGSAAALLVAVSRTDASGSKVSMKRAVAISFGPIGTSALAPIIRSGTGALGSTCFWKLAGSAESGTGQADAAAETDSSLMEAIVPPSARVRVRIAVVAPGPPPGEHSDPLVEEEDARQPGDGRRPAQPQRHELRGDARIVRR